MKKLWLTLTAVLFALPTLGQGHPRPEMVPVPSNAAISFLHLSMQAPSGEGWQVSKPQEGSVEIWFQNHLLKAAITVADERLSSPVSNVQEKLMQLAGALEKRFAQHGKLILTEHVVKTRPGGQCLYERIIINSPELTAPGLPPGNLAVHDLECIYGPDHQGMAHIRYMYPTQGNTDQQKKLAQDFFATISFKPPPAK